MVEDLPEIVFAAVLAALALRAWLRHRRGVRVLAELGPALGLAAEAQQVHWRLERSYTDDRDELVRLRHDLAPYLDGSRHGDLARWDVDVSDDGKTFSLVVLAGPMRRFRKVLGYRHLLSAEGDRGQVAYDAFAEDVEHLPRSRRVVAAAR